MPRIVFFTIHSTTPFWTYLGSRIDFADVTVLSDFRGDGDCTLVEDFYRFMRQGDPAAAAIRQFDAEGCRDIIRRCRVLRSLDCDLAHRMIGAMAHAIDRALDQLDPSLVMTFTMDRYVMDVMERIARARGIDFLEMTTSVIPDEVIFMRRGRLVQLWDPDEEHVGAAVDVLCRTDFAPGYVRDAKRFSIARFWQVYGYFALRGAYFNLLRGIERDPLNLHYLDALKRLQHKVGWRDVTALCLFDAQWQKRLADVERERRVFFGLQLFPEASLDYWLHDPSLLDHDDVVMRYCEVLGEGGYHVFVKDHPLQFGFRQRELIQRLSRLPCVTLVPYDVPASYLLAQSSVSVTFTGTIGFQAALGGLCSVASESYYATEKHYVHVRNRAEIEDLAQRIRRWSPPVDLSRARHEMVRQLARGSVPGDYFTWRRFDPSDPAARAAAESLVRSLNTYLPRFVRLASGGG